MNHPTGPAEKGPSLLSRLPFFYGWVVVAVAFVTMGIGVNVRTAFSLLYPEMLVEFGWTRGTTASVFSVGFVIATLITPIVGRMMDRFGPRVLVPTGAVITALGFLGASVAFSRLTIYLTLGAGVVGASILIGFIGHSLFLPRWFERKRGFAVGIAFAGVGLGAMLLFPWLESYISSFGWRQACVSLGILILVTVVPLNILLQRNSPADLGLKPDGDTGDESRKSKSGGMTIVDTEWAEQEWTLRLAIRTTPFWWLFAGYVTSLHSWYAVQVHQTKYLLEVGFSAADAAFALGLLGLTSVGGQIGVGYLSDRIGREWAWTLGMAGFIACYLLLLQLNTAPDHYVMYLMVVMQGLFGYGVAVVYAAMPADLFQGRHYGSIFGVLAVASSLGAALGPWVTGVMHDIYGSYIESFYLAAGLSLFSILCVWMAAPRRVRKPG